MTTDAKRCDHNEQSTKFKVIAGRNEVYVVTYCKLCQKTLSEEVDTRHSQPTPMK
ncbi:MAG: hypothetical protein HY720_29125 [Planctomycetes bacterium]|nr:hypothetical protein [Planctomycetota bacterium]